MAPTCHAVEERSFWDIRDLRDGGLGGRESVGVCFERSQINFPD